MWGIILGMGSRLRAKKIEVGWVRGRLLTRSYSKQFVTMSAVSKTMNSFAALCESDDEVVVASTCVAPVTMTSEERIAAAIEAIRSRPIPVLPPGGIDLMAISPELARMEYAMRRGISWYDMFLYEDELAEFRKRCDEREARGEPRYLSGPAPRPEVTEVIECDEWTDVRRAKTGGHRVKSERSYPKQRRERRVETPEEREIRRQQAWGW